MRISVITPTHDPRHIQQTWASLKAQTHRDFEWVVALNGGARELSAEEFDRDPRVRPIRLNHRFSGSVGAIKATAFRLGCGDVLLELDHDDLLHPRALELCAEAFEDPAVDFVYSECADFSDPPGQPITYHPHQNRAAWMRDGWRFGTCDVPFELNKIVQETHLIYPISFEPSALSLSLVLYAPNHFRAWRSSFYLAQGRGHDVTLPVGDDHELLVRTYLEGRMKRIPEVLYFYRVDGGNTWSANVERIRLQSEATREKYLHRLVAREMELRGLPCVDLGGAHNSPGAPWVPFDRKLTWPKELPHLVPDSMPGLRRSLISDSRMWPFPDSSIGAFRAVDFLEHLPDKAHAMRELYRCLAPGGWLLSQTPHALGVGAHQDPTHVSQWVENSFVYYTEDRLAQYIREDGVEHPRFMASRLFKTTGEIPYVVADLVSLKDDDGRLPGRRGITGGATK